MMLTTCLDRNVASYEFIQVYLFIFFFYLLFIKFCFIIYSIIFVAIIYIINKVFKTEEKKT
jgi:hypothetical protein